MSIRERIEQRVRYFPWWVRHPIEYHRSEQLRRAVNLVAEVTLDSMTAGEGRRGQVRCWHQSEIEGWDMLVTMTSTESLYPSPSALPGELDPQRKLSVPETWRPR